MSTILFENARVGGRFLVRKKLATGGMSHVWLAEDVATGAPVVIKEPKIEADQAATRVYVEKLKHEVKVLRIFRHPYIANLIDAYEVASVKRGGTVVTFSPTPVIAVVEYADGIPLSRYKVPVGEREAVYILRQLLEVLSNLHARGIVHRDIKPHNIILRRSGAIALIDFGTSRYYYDRGVEYVASPGGYTAPEQLAGFSFPQSDIWSVGAVALYLLTGREPWDFMTGYPRNLEFGKYVAPAVSLPKRLSDRMLYFLYYSLNPYYQYRFPTASEALYFLETGRLPWLESGEGLKLAIKGRVIKIYGRVVIGRTDDPREDLMVEGEALYIYDPEKYISRKHVEIVPSAGNWFIRDLGSINGTAVIRQGKAHLIWAGPQNPSPYFQLHSGDIIALAYDEKKGPYLTITVNI